MAYNKTTWQTGDIVTADKLNNLEQGVANAQTMIVHVTEGGSDDPFDFILDCTWSEIKTAFDAGMSVKASLQIEEDGVHVSTMTPMIGCYYSETEYGVTFNPTDITPPDFIASSPDDYPSYNRSN